MRSEVLILANLLDATCDLLCLSGEFRWAARLSSDAVRIRACDFGGVEDLLAAFEGGENLNDLVRYPVRGIGHVVERQGDAAIREKLQGRLFDIQNWASALSSGALEWNCDGSSAFVQTSRGR